MRIITGKAKGIRLKTLEGDLTRPTAERVKEAVFSMIQFDMEGRRVLDICAGSGQLGLEALSRGAERAVLVDRSKEAVKIITENAEKTKLKQDCTIQQCDCIEYILRNSDKKFDIVFLDPPYASGLYTSVLRKLTDCQMVLPHGMIVCESDKEDIFESDSELCQRFVIKKQSKYGKTWITVLELAKEADV